MRLAFTIDGPPKGKDRPRTRVVKGVVMIHPTKEDVQREKVIGAAALAALNGRPRMSGAVRLTVYAVFAIPPSWPKYKREAAASSFMLHTSKPDLDNIAKSVLDGCNPVRKKALEGGFDKIGGIWEDDSQVAEILGRKRYGSPARTEVVVELLDDTGGA